MLIVIESTQVVANILSDSPLAAKQVNPVLEVEGGAGTRKPNQHRYPSFGTQHGSWKGIESKKKSVPTSHSPLQRLAKTQREALHDSDWHHTHLRSCRCIHEVISNYLSSSAGTMQELSPSRRCSGCPARSVYMTVWTKLPKTPFRRAWPPPILQCLSTDVNCGFELQLTASQHWQSQDRNRRHLGAKRLRLPQGVQSPSSKDWPSGQCVHGTLGFLALG